LKEKYGIAHIAAGDIFRENIKEGTPLGKQVEAYLNEGKLVPDEITIKMIAERLEKADCKNGFILDGFPRSIVQAEALEKMLKEKNITLDGVVQMAVDDQELIQRISGRFTCSACGEGYHDQFKKPAHSDSCDKCGAKGTFTRRADDDKETVRKRLQTYHTQTAPILPFYQGRGMLKIVNGMADMADVTRQIEAVLDKNKPGNKPPADKYRVE